MAKIKLVLLVLSCDYYFFGLGFFPLNGIKKYLTRVDLTQLLQGTELRKQLMKCCFTSTETVGAGAQDGHLNFHTVPKAAQRIFFK